MPYTPAQNDAAPYDEVVRVTYASASGGAYQASGVLVSPDVVLTAGHVADGAVPSSILVTPGQSGGLSPYGSSGATAVAWLPGAPSDGLVTQQQSQDDIGLIALATPLGNQAGWMGLQADYAGGTVETAGYPAYAGGLLEQELLPTQRAAATATLLYPGGSTQPGSSGSPLWTGAGGQATVVGIVSTTSWAAQLTDADLDFIGQFEQQHPAATTTTVGADGDTNAAEVFRLYQAAFNRAPDAQGLGFWTQDLNNGATLLDVAQGFVTSAEFTRDFASPDPAGLVTQFYNNVLHRAPDAAGEQYWVGQLNAGASQAQVLLGFSDSAENRAATAGAIHDGTVLPSQGA